MLGEHVDFRADLYSLTLCAYFALTGSSPFGGGTPASILARHTIGSLPDLKSARSDLNDELIRVLKKGAARDPADRFESAAAFEQAVIESQRRGWLNRFRRWWRSLGRRGLE
jgi:serine/threonine-protein kinase